MKRWGLAVLLALTASACGSTTQFVQTPDESTTTPGSDVGSTTIPEAPTNTSLATTTTTPHLAKVGDSITLNSRTAKLAVTVVKVMDPAHSTDGFSNPSAGSRYAAVQFRIENVGTATYSDSPANEARVIDTLGQQFESDIVLSTDAGPVFEGGTVALPPGGIALGVLMFGVPNASKIAKVQYSTTMFFAGSIGEWII